MTVLTAETLLNIGFRNVARWVSGNDGKTITYLLDGTNATADRALLDVRNALYAFVQDDTVNYIGKTARSIRKRFIGYCTPGKTQRTNWRCHNNLKTLLKDNIAVRILVFTPPPHLRYGDFEIDLAAGLEESLILAFKPPWNGRDGTRPITEEAEREAGEETELSTAGDVNSNQLPSTLVDKELKQPKFQTSRKQTAFQIRLGFAYYNQGFINPGAEASQYLGKHGDPIIVYLGSEAEQVDSVINRTANPNGSVRVVGNNRRIAEWFQQNFKAGDLVNASVQDQQHILLLTRNDKNSI